MINTDKLRFYEQMLEGATHHFAWELIREIKRLRLLFRELIKDMDADDYIEWCNRIGCPNGLEVEASE